MGDLYGGAYLPLLHAHCPEAVHMPAVVAQTVLTLLTHDGLPSVYAYQMHDTHQIRTLHHIPILPPWWRTNGEITEPRQIRKQDAGRPHSFGTICVS